MSRKHQRPGTRYWVKVTPLVKESAWNPETEMAAEESLDIHDVRSRLGGWPIVEAAVSYMNIFCVLDMRNSRIWIFELYYPQAPHCMGIIGYLGLSTF